MATQAMDIQQAVRELVWEGFDSVDPAKAEDIKRGGDPLRSSKVPVAFPKDVFQHQRSVHCHAFLRPLGMDLESSWFLACPVVLDLPTNAENANADPVGDYA